MATWLKVRVNKKMFQLVPKEIMFEIFENLGAKDCSNLAESSAYTWECYLDYLRHYWRVNFGVELGSSDVDCLF